MLGLILIGCLVVGAIYLAKGYSEARIELAALQTRVEALKRALTRGRR